MAKVTYKSYNQNDSLLFPHCIGDFIPENDPVRVLDAIVEHLDISAIEATYKGGGASSFAPRMLLKVILYAYLQNWKSPVCVTPKAQVPLTLESKFRMTPIKS